MKSSLRHCTKDGGEQGQGPRQRHRSRTRPSFDCGEVHKIAGSSLLGSSSLLGAVPPVALFRAGIPPMCLRLDARRRREKIEAGGRAARLILVKTCER